MRKFCHALRFDWSWLVGLFALTLLPPCTAQAAGPDDQYVQIYKIIQKADALGESGKVAQAHTNYVEAHAALAQFQRDYPYWNPKLVSYRMDYVARKLAELAAPSPTQTNTGAAKTPGPGDNSKAAGVPSKIQVKLLEPGADPRKELRLHPSPGDSQKLEMTLKLSLETKMAEAEVPAVRLPAIKLTLETTIKSVAEDGDIAFEMVIADVNVAGETGAAAQMVEAMKGSLTGIKGAAGSGRVSSRGLGSGVEFKLPPGADPQARQMMNQMKELYTQLMPPLPVEPVGAGARWEVKSPVKSQGATINQTATYEVVSLEGEQLVTKSVILQEAANQKVQNPAVPKLKMELIKMTGRTTGERTFDLTKLMPISGTGAVHAETSLAMSVGAQKQTMSTKLDVNLNLESK